MYQVQGFREVYPQGTQSDRVALRAEVVQVCLRFEAKP